MQWDSLGGATDPGMYKTVGDRRSGWRHRFSKPQAHSPNNGNDKLDSDRWARFPLMQYLNKPKLTAAIDQEQSEEEKYDKWHTNINHGNTGPDSETSVRIGSKHKHKL